MDFCEIEGATRRMAAPSNWDEATQGPCGTLPIRDMIISETAFMVSAWRPSAEDIERLNAGAAILLGIQGVSHPVVFLQLEDPAPGAQPARQWRCYHCDQVFDHDCDARHHFGMDPSADPACKIKAGAEHSLVVALRRLEAELSEAWGHIHNESTEAAKAYFAQQARHHEQLQATEELGYERGLRDGRAEVTSLRNALTKVSNLIGKDFEAPAIVHDYQQQLFTLSTPIFESVGMSIEEAQWGFSDDPAAQPQTPVAWTTTLELEWLKREAPTGRMMWRDRDFVVKHRISGMSRDDSPVPLFAYPAVGGPTVDDVDRVTKILTEAWAKAEPDHAVTKNPTSYVATFIDMARAVTGHVGPFWRCGDSARQLPNA